VTDWAAIAAGTFHTVALKSGGTQPTTTPVPAASGWGLAALIAAMLVVLVVALPLTSGSRRAARP